MLTAAKDTSLVSIPTASGYTGLFLFSCLPSFAAKRKTPAIQAPYLWLKRPPVPKPRLGDSGGSVYHIKKEFDTDGVMGELQVEALIEYGENNFGVPTFEIIYDDGDKDVVVLDGPGQSGEKLISLTGESKTITGFNRFCDPDHSKTHPDHARHKKKELRYVCIPKLLQKR